MRVPRVHLSKHVKELLADGRAEVPVEVPMVEHLSIRESHVSVKLLSPHVYRAKYIAHLGHWLLHGEIPICEVPRLLSGHSLISDRSLAEALQGPRVANPIPRLEEDREPATAESTTKRYVGGRGK